jgi:hypothetical protein
LYSLGVFREVLTTVRRIETFGKNYQRGAGFRSLKDFRPGMLQVCCFIGAYSKTFLSALRLREVDVGCPTSVPDANCTNASFKGFLSSPAIFSRTSYLEIETSNDLLTVCEWRVIL